MIRSLLNALFFFFVLSFVSVIPQALAASAASIQEDYDQALKTLEKEVPGARETLLQSKGVLVFPNLWKAGFGLGGEYDEGLLKVGGKPADYYSMIGLSLGFQLGVQKQTIVIVFLDEFVLEEFRGTANWEFALDGSAALIEMGIDGRIDSYTSNRPVVVYVIGQKGLMYNLTLEAYKLTKLAK